MSQQRQPRRGAATLTGSKPLEQGIELLKKAPQRQFSEVQSDPGKGARDSENRVALYCLENGQLFRCLTNLPNSTALVPGREGSLIGMPRSPFDSGAFVIHGDTVTFAADLHQMALKSHELLLKTAPVRSQPPGAPLNSSWGGSNPSILRAGDVLWINHRNIKFIRQAGSPVLATRESGLVVRRFRDPYGGYRLCSGEARREIKCTFSRILDILSETTDGQLLCSSPEGITWLTRGGDGSFGPGREIAVHVGGHVHSFVGEAESQVFVTVIDTDQPYLAVLDRQ